MIAPEPSEAALTRPTGPTFAEEGDAAAIAAAAAPAEEVEADPEVETRVQKRFNTLTAKNAALLARLAAFEAAKAAPPAVAAPVPAAAPVVGKRPVSGDFETYEDYVTAIVKFERSEERATEAREAAAKAASESAAAQAKAWSERAAVSKAAHPDWDAVVMEAGSKIPISQTMHNFIVESDVGPELSYALGTNLPELQRIAALSPTAARRALTALELSLTPAEAATAPAPAAISRAPKPAAVVSGASGADPAKEPDPKNFQEWDKWAQRRDRAAAKAANGE